MARYRSSKTAIATPVLPRSHLNELAKKLGLKKLTHTQCDFIFYECLSRAIADFPDPTTLEAINAFVRSYPATADVMLGPEEVASLSGSQTTFDDMIRHLQGFESSLREIAETFVVREGFTSDSIGLEISGLIIDALHRLGVRGTDGNPIYSVVDAFGQDASVLAEACKTAYLELEKRKVSVKSGPSPAAWYDHVARAVIFLCRLNGIRCTISTDRVTGERSGRFLDIARALEVFLPEPMRSSSLEGLRQRLRRSKERIERERNRAPQVSKAKRSR